MTLQTRPQDQALTVRKQSAITELGYSPGQLDLIRETIGRNLTNE